MIPEGYNLLAHRSTEHFQVQVTRQQAFPTPTGSSTRLCKGFGFSPDFERAVALALADLAVAETSARDDASRTLPAYAPLKHNPPAASRRSGSTPINIAGDLDDLLGDLGL